MILCADRNRFHCVACSMPTLDRRYSQSKKPASDTNPPKTPTSASTPTKKSPIMKSPDDIPDSSETSSMNLFGISKSVTISPVKTSPNDAPGPSGTSNINLSATSISSCVTLSPMKKSPNVKNPNDTPGPSGSPSMNLSTTNTSLSLSILPVKKSPNMNSPIDTPGPSGISANQSRTSTFLSAFISPGKKFSNVKTPIDTSGLLRTSSMILPGTSTSISAIISPRQPATVKNPNDSSGSSGIFMNQCRTSTSLSAHSPPHFSFPHSNSEPTLTLSIVSPKKRSCVKKLQQQAQFEQHEEKEDFDLQKYIEQIRTNIEKCIKYLQQYSSIQVDMLAQVSVNFNKVQSRQKEQDKRLQNMENIQLSTLQEIRNLTAHHHKMNNFLAEMKNQFSSIFENQKTEAVHKKN